MCDSRTSCFLWAMVTVAFFGSWNFSIRSAIAEETTATVLDSTIETIGQGKTPKLVAVNLLPDGKSIFEFVGEAGGILSFRLHPMQLDDLLKSIVVQGFDNAEVHYPHKSQEQSAPKIDTRNVATLAELIQAHKGKEITILNGEEEFTGVVVAVELQSRSNRAEDKLLAMTLDSRLMMEEQEWVTLLHEKELFRVPLYLESKVRWKDDSMARSLESGVLGEWPVDEPKLPVTLTLKGKEGTQGRIAFVAMNSPWKTTYRITREDTTYVLASSAIVDNTTEWDWEDVQLRLLIDSSVGFHSPLSRLLHPQRDSLSVPTMQSPHPIRIAPAEISKEQALPLPFGRGILAHQGQMAGGMGGMGGMSGSMQSYAYDESEGGNEAIDHWGWGGSSSLSKGTRIATQELGDDFQSYGLFPPAAGAIGKLSGRRTTIEIPHFTLKKGCSMETAMPAIPSRLRELRVYLPGYSEHHPIAAIQIHLADNYQLLAGPGSVWGERGYMGDIMVPDLNAQESQIISFALDSEIDVEKMQTTTTTNPLDPFSASGWIDEEVLCSVIESKSGNSVAGKFLKTRKFTYRISNRSKVEREMYIEHSPSDSSYTPMNAISEDQNLFRYSVSIPAGETKDLDVEEAHGRDFVLTPLSSADDLASFLERTQVPGDCRTLVQSWLAKRETNAQIDRDRFALREELIGIENQQKRIKELMVAVPPDDALRDRFSKKLGELEDLHEQKQTKLSQLAK